MTNVLTKTPKSLIILEVRGEISNHLYSSLSPLVDDVKAVMEKAIDDGADKLIVIHDGGEVNTITNSPDQKHMIKQRISICLNRLFRLTLIGLLKEPRPIKYDGCYVALAHMEATPKGGIKLVTAGKKEVPFLSVEFPESALLLATQRNNEWTIMGFDYQINTIELL